MIEWIFSTLPNLLTITLSSHRLGVTPFYAYTGYHPRWCVLETLELPTNPRGEDNLERLHKIQADLSTHLHQAQQTHKAYADRHRFPSYFDIGDRV